MNINAKPIVEGLAVLLLGGAIIGLWQLNRTVDKLGVQVGYLSTTIEQRTADPYTSKDAARDKADLLRLINNNLENNNKQDAILQGLIRFQAQMEERERQREEQRRKVEDKVSVIDDRVRTLENALHLKEK